MNIYIYKEEMGEGEESTKLKTEADARNSKGEPYSLRLVADCVGPTIKLPYILLKKKALLCFHL